MIGTTRRWFTVILKEYRTTFEWERDAGLCCKTLIDLGVDSKLVALGDEHVDSVLPLILAPRAKLEDPSWWRQWKLEGVILYSWAAPRFEPVARAISEAGIKLVLKVDTAGLKSPIQGFSLFLKNTYGLYRELGASFPAIKALLKTVLFRVAPRVHDLPMLEHLSHANVIGIESPVAINLMNIIYRAYGRIDLNGRTKLIPHPVTTNMTYDATVTKRDCIVAVGRWDSYLKDAPTLIAVLSRALDVEPEYTAKIVGSGTGYVRRLVSKLPPSIRQRIELCGIVSHKDLPEIYQRAKITLVSSRSESGPLAAQEALCCGCSVVGPATLPSLNYFCSQSSGSLSVTRSIKDISDVLLKEIDNWRHHHRDPPRISEHFRGVFHAPRVVQKILQTVEQQNPVTQLASPDPPVEE